MNFKHSPYLRASSRIEQGLFLLDALSEVGVGEPGRRDQVDRLGEKGLQLLAQGEIRGGVVDGRALAEVGEESRSRGDALRVPEPKSSRRRTPRRAQIRAISPRRDSISAGSAGATGLLMRGIVATAAKIPGAGAGSGIA
jgi:hypothetical protein